MRVPIMKSLPIWLAGGLAMLLWGCGSVRQAPAAVEQGVDAQGTKTVTAAPAPLVCSGPRCPMLGAAWSADRPGLVVLTVGLPYQSSEVTGADFHLGPDGIVRIRLPVQGKSPALGYPATSFDVPLRLVSQIAYTPRSWLRVHTADGLRVDESIDTGEERAQAADTMATFLSMVQTAGGKSVPAVGTPRGGVFERLGVGQ